MIFKIAPLFETPAYFYVTISGNFERFQYFNFETNSLENANLFQKNRGIAFYLKVPILKTDHFHKKLPFHKPMLRQIKCWVQNGPIIKNGILFLVTALFSWKFCFSLIVFLKRVDLVYQRPKCPYCIHTFHTRWRFIWGCFFQVSILKEEFTNCLIKEGGAWSLEMHIFDYGGEAEVKV